MVDGLQALRDTVAALPTGPHPDVLQGLRSLREAVAAIPGPDPGVAANVAALTETVRSLPTGPDPVVVDGLQALRDTVAALPSDLDRDVIDGLRSIRQVMDALVDLVVGLRPALLAVNQKLDVTASALDMVLTERASHLEALQRSDDSILELRHGITERFNELGAWMQLVTKQQTRAESTADTTRKAVGQMAQAVTEGEVLVVRLDSAQLRAIVTAVAEVMQEASTAGRPRRTKPLRATGDPSKPWSA